MFLIFQANKTTPAMSLFDELSLPVELKFLSIFELWVGLFILYSK